MLLGTVVFGLLAGYALAVLQFRGKGAVFAGVLLVLVVPFQLLTVPLYVLIVRDYGLADSYLGMILPFAINSTAVFVFRQFFLQLPERAVRGRAHRRRGRAHDPDADRDPAVQAGAADRGAADLHRPVERVPLAVPRDQGADMQPLAVSLANYIGTVSGRAANPFGAILAGACVLAAPAVVAVPRLPAAVRRRADRLGGQGMTVTLATFPFSLTRCGVVMSPLPGTRTRPRAC